MAEVQTIEIGASVKLSGVMRWRRLPDGTESCEPCAAAIALRVYERDSDASLDGGEEAMREAAIRVLDQFFWDAVPRTAPAVSGKPRFMLVNGLGLCLTASGVWSFEINPRKVRVFKTRDVAERVADASPYERLTVVELDPEPPAPET